MKQTAVDWLVQELSKKGDYGLSFYLEHKYEIIQAKDIEMHQILNTYIEASPKRGDILKEASERYYNETFNTNEK
jgi:hypothetical protein